MNYTLRQFVRAIAWITAIITFAIPFVLLAWGFAYKQGLPICFGVIGGFVYWAVVGFGFMDGETSIFDRLYNINNWALTVKPKGKGVSNKWPLKPPLDKQALYEAIVAHHTIKIAIENYQKEEIYVNHIYKISYDIGYVDEWYGYRDMKKPAIEYIEGTIDCKLRIWYRWKTIFCFNENSRRRSTSSFYEKKYNDHLVHLLELLTGEDSTAKEEDADLYQCRGCVYRWPDSGIKTRYGGYIGCLLKNCINKSKEDSIMSLTKNVNDVTDGGTIKQEETKMEDAKYEAVNVLTGEAIDPIDQTALMEFTDGRRGKHVEAIKERNAMIHKQMVELAKDLFTVSMYRQENLVTIDNCKMAVELSLISPTNSEKGRLIVNLYLNKTSKNDKRMNWKDVINSMASEREIKPVISSIRELGKKSRIPNIFSKKTSLSTSYEVTRQWDIVYRNFNQDFVRLLPTARMLVDEQLSILYTDTIADTGYLEAMFLEAEGELNDSPEQKSS